MSLQIDVHRNRVGEITSWFNQQGVVEHEVVKQSGWILTNSHYRIEFYPGERELAMLFKLALGGE